MAPKKPNPPKKKGEATRKREPAKPTKRTAKATAPYADLRPAPPPVLKDIPWGYGDVRIVAMARDPFWACAYWEITDDAIATAREKLKDPHAGLALRVYDTTHRDFNGLNAHVHWDLGFDRSTNRFHIRIGKPGASIHIDVGALSGNGSFQPIARSNALEMPRDSVSPDTRLEATTIFRSGPGFTYSHRYTPPPPSAAPPPPPPFEAQYPTESEQIIRALNGEGWMRTEWTETLMDGRVVRWIRWSGPAAPEHLTLLTKSGGTYRTVEVLFSGERRIIKEGGGEKIVYGPWRVTLEAVGPKGERRTIERWALRRRWTTEEGVIRVQTPALIRRILGGSRITVVQAGSESRLLQDQWGSEMLQIGASEWPYIGASENLAQGSSEILQGGASETLYLGASESAYQSSSESFYLGASETFDFGASERLRGGSSEDRP
jgi:hypothetical protein